MGQKIELTINDAINEIILNINDIDHYYIRIEENGHGRICMNDRVLAYRLPNFPDAFDATIHKIFSILSENRERMQSQIQEWIQRKTVKEAIKSGYHVEGGGHVMEGQIEEVRS